MRLYECVHLDFSHVQDLLIEGCRQVFSYWLKELPRERFYAFGIYGLSDLYYFNPSVNTTAGHRETLIRNAHHFPPRRNSVLRYSPCEWKYAWPDELYEPFRLVNRYFVTKEAWSNVEHEILWANSCLCMLYALEVLRDEIVCPATNGNALLIASIFDHPYGELLELTSIEYLIPSDAGNRILDVYRKCPLNTFALATSNYNLRTPNDPIVLTRKMLGLPPY